jgi:hypothetical protein
LERAVPPGDPTTPFVAEVRTDQDADLPDGESLDPHAQAHLAAPAQLRYAHHRIRVQQERIAELAARLAVHERELDGIYRSRSWSYLRSLWRLRRRADDLLKTVRQVRDGRRPAPAAAPRPTATSPYSVPPAPPLAADLPPAAFDIVCLAICEWSFRWQRPQQLMRQFAQSGVRVFYVRPEQPYSPETTSFAATEIEPNVWNVTLSLASPLDIHGAGTQPATARDLFGRGVEQAIDGLRKRFQIGAAAQIVQIPTWAPAAYRLRDRFGWPILYDCMDDWDTFDGVGPTAIIEEQHLVRRADLLAVSSQLLYDKWSPLRDAAGDSLALVRNAADFEHFHAPIESPAGTQTEPLDLHRDHRPIVGYFGAIAPWFDVELMTRVARARPDYDFLMIGPIADEVSLEPLEPLDNVTFLGPKPYAEMPRYLQQFDVCIIPFRTGLLIEATNPVKFYEYISQGKPVVSVDMPELAQYADCAYISYSPDELLQNIDRALREDSPERRARVIEVARQHTWARRRDQLHEYLLSGFEPVTLVVPATAQTAGTVADAVKRCGYPRITLQPTSDAESSAPASGITVLLNEVDVLGALDLWGIVLAHREHRHGDRRSTAWIVLLERPSEGRCGIVVGWPPGEPPMPFDPRFESAFFRWEDVAYRIMLQGGRVTVRTIRDGAGSPGHARPTSADRARFEQKWNVRWDPGWAPPEAVGFNPRTPQLRHSG